MIPSTLLRHKCNFEQRTGTRSATSGQTNYTWAAVYSNERCRLIMVSGNRLFSQTSLMERTTHILVINRLPSTTINEKDWRIDIDEIKYTILSLDDAEGMGHHYEIQLERIA